jgi:tetratricopeptide (TPR) repeat protein/cold shock CspA family protein
MTRDEAGASEQLAALRAQRERGDLRQILARYGSIDQERGPLWDDVEFVLEIARTYSLLGNDTKVEQYFLRCAQLHPRRAALYRCQIGWFFQRKKRWARALLWYDRALQTFPSYHLCLFRKGYCLERLHRPRAASAALDLACAAFDKAPPDQRERSRGIQVQILFHLARNLREIGLTERAREALERCAELDDQLHEKVIKPEHRLASYGETYLRDGDPAAALEHLEAARQIDPSSAVIWERIGRAHELAGRFDDAEQALRRATELAKGAVALIPLGRLLMRTGRHAEAARSLCEALKLHPQGEVQIRMELAELQATLGRPQAALADLGRLAAGRVPPQSTLAVAVETRIATILLEHGQVSNALARLQTAADHDPESGEVQALLEQARAHLVQGREEVRPFDDVPLPADVAAILGEDAPARMTGHVTNYFADRGFGFIAYGQDNATLFFHVSQCEPAPPENLGPGLSVSFVIGVNHRSRKQQAEHIRVTDAQEIPVGEPGGRESQALQASVASPTWRPARALRAGGL